MWCNTGGFSSSLAVRLWLYYFMSIFFESLLQCLKIFTVRGTIEFDIGANESSMCFSLALLSSARRLLRRFFFASCTHNYLQLVKIFISSYMQNWKNNNLDSNNFWKIFFAVLLPYLYRVFIGKFILLAIGATNNNSIVIKNRN